MFNNSVFVESAISLFPEPNTRGAGPNYTTLEPLAIGQELDWSASMGRCEIDYVVFINNQQLNVDVLSKQVRRN